MAGGARSWPGGRRVAVLVSVLFETWADGKWPGYFPRHTPLRAGTVDRGAIQWARYAGNEGIWRILRVLERCNVRATVLASGLSGVLFPEALRETVRAGHDIGGHGWTQDELLCYLAPEEERANIRRTLDALEKASGQRPEGWASPAYSWTEHTFDMLVEEGVTWYADALDIGLPRRQKTRSGSIFAFPWSDFVDNRVLRASPRVFLEVYRDTFDYLYAHEPMGLIHIGFHAHYGGRPLMSAMLAKVLDYFRGYPDVWFARHRELMQWMIGQGIDELPHSRGR